MPTIYCLRQQIASGSQHYPVFIGFLPAAEILQIAEAPSFSNQTMHQTIAQNVLTPPIKDWQRPLVMGKVDRISQLFDNTGELMPNPVLLSENVTSAPAQITVRQQMATGSIPTMVYEVDIPGPAAGNPKPLWILDGQHRISGLARSAQADNHLPVVILLNQGLAAYGGPILAKLFAQVTTSATELDKLHNEWLTFAFQLDDYATTAPGSFEHRQSMETVARLCLQPLLSPTGPSNPFCNQIQFNIHVAFGPQPGGFKYDCISLKEIIRKFYYSRVSQIGSHLAPLDLARQIGFAYLALTQKVPAPLAKSVFFGDAEHEQKIMQDAYLAGILTYLLQHPPPADWKHVLDTLLFGTTNWDFKSWYRTLSGPAQTNSKKLAVNVMCKVFRASALPAGAGNLADFLRGNNAKVTLQFSNLTPAGRVSTRDRDELEVTRGAVLSRSIAPRTHVKISGSTENIGNLVVTDKNSPPGRTVRYDLASGLVLDPTVHSNPLSLLITMEHYGGISSMAELDINW